MVNEFAVTAPEAYKLVVVALVVVPFVAVKFWRVVEPVCNVSPPSFANKVFGSKKNLAEVVAVAPIEIMSVLFRE